MTTNFQTWRAISGGTLYFVEVHHRGGAQLVHATLRGFSRNLDPVFAVSECLRGAGLPPATEIRGPGEPTTAEAVAAAIATERGRCKALHGIDTGVRESANECICLTWEVPFDPHDAPHHNSACDMHPKNRKRARRWGTCVDCPRDADGVHPTRCRYAARFDHNLRETSR